MLHVVTPVTRTNNLEEIWTSMSDRRDVRWHLACNEATVDEVRAIWDDFRISIYAVRPVSDDVMADRVVKRNVCFAHISDGYVCMLDDDTILHPNMYNLYRKLSTTQFKGILIGTQVFPESRLIKNRGKMPTETIETTFIDTGMGLMHHSVVQQIVTRKPDKYGIDRTFYSDCYRKFGKERFMVTDQIVSYYNAIKPIYRFHVYFLGREMYFEINNSHLAYFFQKTRWVVMRLLYLKNKPA